MKTIYYLTTALLFAIIMVSCSVETLKENQEISANSLEASDPGLGESCLGEAPSSCYSGTYTWSITLPGYPECELIVSVNYYACFGEVVAYLHLGEFDYTINLGCDDFIDDWNHAIQNGVEEQFVTGINSDIWTQVTANLLDGFSSSYYTVMEVEYNIGSCVYLCGLDQLRCGDACCQKTNTWEKDVNGDWTLTDVGDIILSGTSCNTYQDPICSPNELQSSECFDNCASLDF